MRFASRVLALTAAALFSAGPALADPGSQNGVADFAGLHGHVTAPQARAALGVPSCPAGTSCTTLNAFLVALQANTTVSNALGGRSAALDIETTLVVGSPAWVEFERGGLIAAGDSLAAAIQARYGLTATAMTALFASAGTMTAAPSPVAPAAKSYDVGQLQAYGYIGDGASHPLSSITSVLGLSTAGWTLAQWQIVAPAATAMTDEIDGAALNSVIAAATGPIAIRLGVTSARLSHPIASCAQSVSLDGAGPQQTVLTFVAGTDGWDHCPSGAATATKLEINRLTMVSSVLGGTNYGVNATFAPAKNAEFRDVEFRGFGNCSLVTNAGGALLDHAWCDSGLAQGAGVGNGFEFAGTSTFKLSLRDTLAQGYVVGYRFHSTNPAGGLGIEDVALANAAAGGGKTCVQIVADYSGYSPLDYDITDFSCDATSGFVDAEAVSELNIRGGNWLIDPPVGGWTGAGQDFFTFKRVNSARLRDAWISNNAIPMTIGSFIHVLDSGPAVASDVQITGNKLEYQGLTATTVAHGATAPGLIAKDINAGGIVAKDNTWTNFFAVGPAPANAYSWASFDAASALFLGLPGEVQRAGTSNVAVVSGVPGNVTTLALNPGLWDCAGSIAIIPASGTTVQTFQGASSTVPATLPTNPAGGTFLLTAQSPTNLTGTVGRWIYDFTAATAPTTVYEVGNAGMTGGASATFSGILTCIRLR